MLSGSVRDSCRSRFGQSWPASVSPLLACLLRVCAPPAVGPPITLSRPRSPTWDVELGVHIALSCRSQDSVNSEAPTVGPSRSEGPKALLQELNGAWFERSDRYHVFALIPPLKMDVTVEPESLSNWRIQIPSQSSEERVGGLVAERDGGLDVRYALATWPVQG